MMGERKSEIYPLIPKEFLPEMQLCEAGNKSGAIESARKMGFPVIVKPDIGERGRMVERIDSAEELGRYVQCCNVPFFVQEFVAYPVELSLFYIRLPDEPTGRVTSVVQKDFLKVVGDGRSTVKELLERDARAALLVDFSRQSIQDRLTLIPVKDKVELVEPIGNHCRGTVFINQNTFIDKKLHCSIDRLAKRIPGFYFGRFDLKCLSIEDLKEGLNFKILELNGAGAEPAHIYQPGYSLIAAYRDIIWHLTTLAKVSHQNSCKGHNYWSFARGMKKFWEIRAYTQKITQV